MLKLYHCPNARSFRALWTLEEMALPYELEVLPFPPRVKCKAFLELNPLGTVPLLIDGDVRMTESAAICQYLPVRHGPSDLAVRPDEPGYADWLEWLHFSEATLTYPLTIALRYGFLTPEDQRPPLVADDHKAKFLGRLRLLESLFQDREYVAAGRFTSADIAVAFNFTLGDFMKLTSDYPPAVAAYWERLKTRPGYERTVDAQRRGIAAMKARLAAEEPAGS
ncbi:MAG: glutathione S-transferase family protein [Sphingobium sp.]